MRCDPGRVTGFCCHLPDVLCLPLSHSVFKQSSPKGITVPYRPKPVSAPVIFAGGQAYTIQGQFAIPHPDLTKLHQLAMQQTPFTPVGQTSPGYSGQSLGWGIGW
ncbi:poly(rC)-binding protein 3-like [Chiloscyllium plagiosum]|uniref:poly(rC)-binding protein 3-like n=1 Tax=Chiloscyllium plagiosum TaxID=36176 RepID=UPI001CB864B8|nr:poly(rC)-binding protein 3-like [Chiloscyllium plagiosum]